MSIGSLFAAAVLLTAPVGEPPAIAPHVKDNIRWSVQSADVAALVTVTAAPARSGPVSMRVEEVVLGELQKGQVLQVSTAKFIRQDLEAGKVLLVFLDKTGKGLVSTGRYELEIEGKIRDIATAEYLAANRAQAAELMKRRAERKARLKPAPVANAAGS